MVVDTAFSRQMAEACHSITQYCCLSKCPITMSYGGERIPIVITLISRSTTLADLDLPCKKLDKKWLRK